MSLSKILILAGKKYELAPEIFRQVLFQTIFNGFCFANISRCPAIKRVSSSKNVHSCTLNLFTLHDLVQFRARPSDSFARPVGNLTRS